MFGPSRNIVFNNIKNEFKEQENDEIKEKRINTNTFIDIIDSKTKLFISSMEKEKMDVWIQVAKEMSTKMNRKYYGAECRKEFDQLVMTFLSAINNSNTIIDAQQAFNCFIKFRSILPLTKELCDQETVMLLNTANEKFKIRSRENDNKVKANFKITRVGNHVQMDVISIEKSPFTGHQNPIEAKPIGANGNQNPANLKYKNFKISRPSDSTSRDIVNVSQFKEKTPSFDHILMKVILEAQNVKRDNIWEFVGHVVGAKIMAEENLATKITRCKHAFYALVDKYIETLNLCLTLEEACNYFEFFDYFQNEIKLELFLESRKGAKKMHSIQNGRERFKQSLN